MTLTDNGITLTELIKENNYKIGAELGVCTANLTCYLLENNPELKLIAVDSWENHDKLNIWFNNHEDNYKESIEKLSKYEDRVEIIRDLTHNAASKVENGSLDFVYIDANHTAESLMIDVYFWLPKIKETGMLCGHDYNHGEFAEYSTEIEKICQNGFIKDDSSSWFCKKVDLNMNEINRLEEIVKGILNE